MRCAARQVQEVGLPTVGVVANYERGCSTVFEDQRLTCEMLWGSAHKVTKGRHFAMPLTPSFGDLELLRSLQRRSVFHQYNCIFSIKRDSRTATRDLTA